MFSASPTITPAFHDLFTVRHQTSLPAIPLCQYGLSYPFQVEESI